MTTPSSPSSISISNVNVEVGRASNYTTDMDWIRGQTKTSIGGSTLGSSASAIDLNTLYNKTYYQNSTAGNCDNGNCTNTGGNCGNKNCADCYTSAINCINCDSTSYLQPNCNCRTTNYNCTKNQYTINCDCDCPIVCACACSACRCACSDISLKDEVETITGALETVDKLEGVYYTWNGKAGHYGKIPGQRTMGTIAQKTQTVVPETTGMYKDVLTIDPDGINGLLIEAIKELKKEVNQLKKGHYEV